MPPPASKPASPDASSQRSSAASIGVVEAALRAADATFSEKPSSPPSEERGPLHGSLDGRHRLGGAFAIAPERIRPDPSQPRRQLDSEAQQELNASVKRLGIIQPITVRYIEDENIYRIVTGERRYHAACETGLSEIPCWVQDLKENQVLQHQIVENWQRLDMHPFDLADALARLRDANSYSQRDLARETGKTEGEISKLLAILDLDPAVQKLARDDQTGRISRRHLYAIRALPAERQLSLLRRAQQEATTAINMEELAAKETNGPPCHRRRGAPVSHHRYSTSQAIVSLTFRKKDVTTEDILASLDEVRFQVRPPTMGDVHSPTA
jgi:ParB family chromosome partitioning protein